MNIIIDQFSQHVERLNEEVGRGRGTVGGFKTAKTGFEDFVKTINYDFLNRSTHHIFAIEKYNFNNFYTLDIRGNIDKLLTAWEGGADIYADIFRNLYSGGVYDKNMRTGLHQAYVAYYKELEDRKRKNGKPLSAERLVGKGSDAITVQVSTISAPEPPPLDTFISSPLEDLLKIPEFAYVYDNMPVVSVVSTGNGGESLAIKRVDFVPLIMDGLTSAARGHIPQGVTIEEVLDGMFARKPMMPDQGSFINKVKDPTSDKAFDFRSWDVKTLESLHDIIMKVFKRAEGLDHIIPELSQIGAPDIKRRDLFLYMTQKDFHRLEGGGKGASNLAKSIIKDIGVVSEIPDF